MKTSWRSQALTLRLFLYRALRLLQVNDYTFIFIVAAFVGIAAGFLGAAARFWFVISFNWVWNDLYPRLISALPGLPEIVIAVLIPVTGGLLLGPLTRKYPDATRGHHGIPNVMEKIAFASGEIPPSTIALRTLATTVTIASGGSAGRESPVVQIGAAAGSLVAQWLRLSPNRIQMLLACGASAGLAAAFDTPLTGVMFAVELFLGEWTMTSMGPLVVSAIFGVSTARMSFPSLEVIKVPVYQIHSVQEILIYLLVGVVCGVFSWIFVKTLNAVEDAFEHSRIPPHFHMVIGAFGAGILGYFYHQVRGSQYEPITMAMEAKVLLATGAILFVAKFVATVLTLGSGCSGGELAPALFIGAMLGTSLGWAIQVFWPGRFASPGVYALVGMVAFTGAMMHAPITLVLMAVEMTKSYQAVIPMLTAVMTATLIARMLDRDSIYTAVLRKHGILFYLGRDETILREIRVEQIMHRDVPTIPRTMPFVRIVDEVMRHRGMYFPVVDEQRRLIGIISLDDLKAYLKHEELAGLVVAQDIANESMLILSPRETLFDALSKMNRSEMDELPVVEQGRLVGMVSRRDIMKAYHRAVIERQALVGVES